MQFCMEVKVQSLVFLLKCSIPFVKFYFMTGLLTAWSSPAGLGWLAREVQGSTCLCFPCTEIINEHHHAPLFCGFWGIKLRSVCLYSKHITDWAIYSRPLKTFIKISITIHEILKGQRAFSSRLLISNILPTSLRDLEVAYSRLMLWWLTTLRILLGRFL